MPYWVEQVKIWQSYLQYSTIRFTFCAIVVTKPAYLCPTSWSVYQTPQRFIRSLGRLNAKVVVTRVTSKLCGSCSRQLYRSIGADPSANYIHPWYLDGATVLSTMDRFGWWPSKGKVTNRFKDAIQAKGWTYYATRPPHIRYDPSVFEWLANLRLGSRLRIPTGKTYGKRPYRKWVFSI